MNYLYRKFATYYDLIYSKKDYRKEVAFVCAIARRYHVSGKRALDVACGTGNHALALRKRGYDVTGIDLHQEMLGIARKKVPSARFVQGTMQTFCLPSRFDIILCAFSAIHYNRSLTELRQTLRNFYNHLNTNGLLIFDMGFSEEAWKGNTTKLQQWEDTWADLVRFAKTRRKGKQGIIDMAYILFKNNKFIFGTEQHHLGIFKAGEAKKILEEIGFSVNIFNNYTPRMWKKNLKGSAVFACAKRH